MSVLYFIKKKVYIYIYKYDRVCSVFRTKAQAWNASFLCVCCKGLCSRSHIGCLGVCFSCLVVLECPVPCTIWKEMATDGGFSVCFPPAALSRAHKNLCRPGCVWNTKEEDYKGVSDNMKTGAFEKATAWDGVYIYYDSNSVQQLLVAADSVVTCKWMQNAMKIEYI